MMRGIQQATLLPILDRFTSFSNTNINWYDTVDNIPRNEDVFTILIAHEFFDALPFHLIRVRQRLLLSVYDDILNLFPVHSEWKKAGMRS